MRFLITTVVFAALGTAVLAQLAKDTRCDTNMACVACFEAEFKLVNGPDGAYFACAKDVVVENDFVCAACALNGKNPDEFPCADGMPAVNGEPGSEKLSCLIRSPATEDSGWRVATVHPPFPSRLIQAVRR
jgi:hypothetical protein